ncbi:MAG: sulfite exporter TauE/SafE family protein, partial [Chloroflexi bacterium]|nr:sulfite exporter TauE/SafE family protein [Chloroflexota bacterium]
MFDLSPAVLVFIGVAGFLTAIMGGIAGIGTAIAMIPVMTFAVGVQEAIPIVTIAVTLNNFGRVWANRAYLDYRVVVWFSLGAVPASVLGAAAFANAPADLLARGLAIFLILLVIYRHLPIGKNMQMHQVKKFAFVGMVQGFLSSIFGGAGPFGAHFFLSYGLYRNAFVGTVALAITSINITKAGTYASFSLLDRD